MPCESEPEVNTTPETSRNHSSRSEECQHVSHHVGNWMGLANSNDNAFCIVVSGYLPFHRGKLGSGKVLYFREVRRVWYLNKSDIWEVWTPTTADEWGVKSFAVCYCSQFEASSSESLCATITAPCISPLIWGNVMFDKNLSDYIFIFMYFKKTLRKILMIFNWLKRSQRKSSSRVPMNILTQITLLDLQCPMVLYQNCPVALAQIVFITIMK